MRLTANTKSSIPFLPLRGIKRSQRPIKNHPQAKSPAKYPPNKKLLCGYAKSSHIPIPKNNKTLKINHKNKKFPPEPAKFKPELSEFNTELSEFNIELSEFNTELSEFNTELSEFNTELSEFNIELSEFNIELSEFNTELSEFNIELSEFNIELSEFNIEFGDFKHLNSRRNRTNGVPTAPIPEKQAKSNKSRFQSLLKKK